MGKFVIIPEHMPIPIDATKCSGWNDATRARSKRGERSGGIVWCCPHRFWHRHISFFSVVIALIIACSATVVIFAGSFFSRLRGEKQSPRTWEKKKTAPTRRSFRLARSAPWSFRWTRLEIGHQTSGSCSAGSETAFFFFFFLQNTHKHTHTPP